MIKWRVKKSTIKSDLHLHTLVSDGQMNAEEALEAAVRLELQYISITDHDSLGSYTLPQIDFQNRARTLGLKLLTGVELDSVYQGNEIHVLGYGIDPLFPPLHDHLALIQMLRKQKTAEQFQGIRLAFPQISFSEEELWLPERQTMMKPHLVHMLLKHQLFFSYSEAARWMNKNIEAATHVPKYACVEMIGLIKKAGGVAVLAHPAYYAMEKRIDLDRLIRELVSAGLDGVEIIYPYLGTGPDFSTMESEIQTWNRLLELAQSHRILGTLGSDAHSVQQMEEFHLHPRYASFLKANIHWL